MGKNKIFFLWQKAEGISCVTHIVPGSKPDETLNIQSSECAERHCCPRDNSASNAPTPAWAWCWASDRPRDLVSWSSSSEEKIDIFLTRPKKNKAPKTSPWILFEISRIYPGKFILPVQISEGQNRETNWRISTHPNAQRRHRFVIVITTMMIIME